MQRAWGPCGGITGPELPGILCECVKCEGEGPCCSQSCGQDATSALLQLEHVADVSCEARSASGSRVAALQRPVLPRIYVPLERVKSVADRGCLGRAVAGHSGLGHCPDWYRYVACQQARY